jgi:hypothetical protein
MSLPPTSVVRAPSQPPLRRQRAEAAAGPARRAPWLLALGCLALAGCGQKGPLTLPPPAQTASAPAAR